MSQILYLVLVGLVLKHFFADYLTQTPWMIGGKGNLRHPGGYIHAGIHVATTGIVLVLCGLDLPFVAMVMSGEFVLHYALDYAKDHYSRGVDLFAQPKMYWGFYGLDQTFHSLTYVGILMLVDLRLSHALP